MNTHEVRDNRALHRYEIETDGMYSLIAYRMHGDAIELYHTEVPEALEGHGLASKLAHAALEDAQSRGIKVIPTCPFVASYIRHHPEYNDLVLVSAM